MKTCNKCHAVLAESAFYKHKQTRDRLDPTCKECKKAYQRQYQDGRSASDIEWVLKERQRKREYQRRKGTAYVPEKHINYIKATARRNPEKFAAQVLFRNAVARGAIQRQLCEKCGKKAQGHHDDYSKPFEVRWLCVKHHAEHHVQLREQELRNKHALSNSRPSA